MNLSDTLNKAADLIEERGWATGNGWVLPTTPEGAPLCLEGGIQAAAGITLLSTLNEDYAALASCPAYKAVADYLEQGDSSLFWWNDDGARTAVVEASRERESVSR